MDIWVVVMLKFTIKLWTRLKEKRKRLFLYCHDDENFRRHTKCRCVFVDFNKDKSVPQNSLYITSELNKYVHSCNSHFATFDVKLPQFETNLRTI